MLGTFRAHSAAFDNKYYDIEEFIFWGSLFVIAIFPFVYVMAKKTRQKRNIEF